MFRSTVTVGALLCALLASCGDGSGSEVETPTTGPVLTTAPTNLTTTTTTPVVQRKIYTIQPGDTLGVIAAGFGTTVDAIMAENGLDSTNLTIGESLVIPPPTTTTVPGTSTSTG